MRDLSEMGALSNRKPWYHLRPGMLWHLLLSLIFFIRCVLEIYLFSCWVLGFKRHGSLVVAYRI